MKHKQRVRQLLTQILLESQRQTDAMAPRVINVAPSPAPTRAEDLDYGVLKDGEWEVHPDASFLRLQQREATLTRELAEAREIIGTEREYHAHLTVSEAQAREALVRLHHELDAYKSFRYWLDEQWRAHRVAPVDAASLLQSAQLDVLKKVRMSLAEFLRKVPEPHEDGQEATNGAEEPNGAEEASWLAENPDSAVEPWGENARAIAVAAGPNRLAALRVSNLPQPRAVRDEPQA